MKKPLLLASLLVLAACQTPREACISDATRDLTVVQRLIGTTQDNITRGYGLEETQEIVTRTDFCTAEAEDGTITRFECEKTEVVTGTRPVAIDLNAERAKLDSLLEQEALLRERASQAVAFCTATYPDE